MRGVFEDYLDRLSELHSEVKGALAGLPGEALDWVPGPEMNSLGVLIVHLTGAERYWLGDVIACDLSGRDRDAEFQISGLSAADLSERLDAMLEYSRKALEALPIEDLEAGRISPRSKREYSVAWALMHALEHTAIHLGHIQIIRQLWDQRTGKATEQ